MRHALPNEEIFYMLRETSGIGSRDNVYAAIIVIGGHTAWKIRESSRGGQVTLTTVGSRVARILATARIF